MKILKNASLNKFREQMKKIYQFQNMDQRSKTDQNL